MRNLTLLTRVLVLGALFVLHIEPGFAQAVPAAPAQPAAQPRPASQPQTGVQPAAAPATLAPSATPSVPSPAATAAAAPAVDFVPDSFDFTKALGEGVEPLNADEAAALAVRSGPSIAKARAVAEQARRAASESVVAFYPRLDLIGQYTRLSKPPVIAYPLPPAFAAATGGQPFAFPLPVEGQWLVQAKASYPVSDLFLSIMPKYRAAKETAQAQDLNAKAARFTVALSAREAFYNYARARAALLVNRFSLAQAEAQLKDIQSLVSAGTQARVEQMRGEANVAAARVGAARAEGAVAVARTALRTLLHRDGDAEIAVTENFAEGLPPVTDGKEELLREALRNRSELRALDMIAGAQLRNVHANDASKLPKLAVAASAEEGNPNQRAAMFHHEWTGTWEALATLSWSPNDYALGSARGDQVEAQRAQTLADMAALEDATRTEVSQAYEDYKASHEAMEAALTGIAAAEESYRVRREQFRAGAAVATDVIISETELNRARLDLINAAIDLRIARARLDRAVERGQAG